MKRVSMISLLAVLSAVAAARADTAQRLAKTVQDYGNSLAVFRCTFEDDLMKQVRPPEPIRSGDKLGAVSGTSVVR